MSVLRVPWLAGSGCKSSALRDAGAARARPGMPRICASLLAAGCALHAAAATAQDSPAIPPLPRILHIIVASGPGVGPDLIARLIGPKLGEALRQNVIVENRAGSNGIVGVQYVARAAPDGSVIVMDLGLEGAGSTRSA